MEKEEFIQLLSPKFKLIRTEWGYTQEQMAVVLGISKKTLVQIEKERAMPSWSTVVVLCALFRTSDIIEQTVGGDAVGYVETVAHGQVYIRNKKTLGGYIWWNTITEKDGFKLQQNKISNHYRILDAEHYRIFSSFHEEEVKEKLSHILGGVINE